MKLKFFCLLLMLGTAGRSFCQTTTREFGFQSDNDSYLAQGSDRYYTNGIFLFYRQALKLTDTSKLKNKVLGFELGQKMYNPQSAQIPAIVYIDRPFAAYLYAGANLNLLYRNEGNLKLSAQVGIVGPGALGQEAQESIHKWFGFYPPDGWQYQVQDGAQLNLAAEYNRLLARGNGIDLTFTSYLNVGNGFSGAGVGPMLRLGNFNQLYSSVSTQSTASNIDKGTLLHPKELFFYYKPTLNYVAYNATIEGSLFGGTHANEITLPKQPLVFRNELGVAYAPNHWVLGFSAIFHTKEVKGMVKAHQWGQATVLYRW